MKTFCWSGGTEVRE